MNSKRLWLMEYIKNGKIIHTKTTSTPSKERLGFLEVLSRKWTQSVSKREGALKKITSLEFQVIKMTLRHK